MVVGGIIDRHSEYIVMGRRRRERCLVGGENFDYFHCRFVHTLSHWFQVSASPEDDRKDCLSEVHPSCNRTGH